MTPSYSGSSRLPPAPTSPSSSPTGRRFVVSYGTCPQPTAASAARIRSGTADWKRGIPSTTTPTTRPIWITSRSTSTRPTPPLQRRHNMPKLQFAHLELDDEASITVFIPGCALPLVAPSDHPNYDAIVAGAKAGDASIEDLFDVSKTVAKRFEKITERVSVANGRVYFDGDEIRNALTKQIVRFISEGGDFHALARFFEKVQANPNEH